MLALDATGMRIGELEELLEGRVPNWMSGRERET